ncbi:hypothetical protein B0I35DRAFT_350501 [Stachybotrys elegans]|uniref:Modin n=1 Tax=Stachybotrys elegans TaxID=80388 RepID=A0A8K0T1G5_9HYPO|nr:hypothetical protein B0I35DRAFT_350501 [Stachybotrys elegans]
MSDVDYSEVIVASVALVVSVIAFGATFMQVLQQYYASARGYSQCNEKVMGEWALTKKRRFKWEELRFEVEFDAPVIFVSPPDNKDGPIAGEAIYFLDGSPESLQNTKTVKDMDLRDEYAKMSEKERIHTADNERASWFVLLYAIQRMEATSADWQRTQYEKLGPPNESTMRHRLPQSPPTLHSHHTLTVALQRKRKSWDTMPSTVTRPYATTTICHLIEMMAALGVYWKEFDRKYDRYRAEGNGFMVRGEKVSELGVMFSFQIYGKCHFEKNRVVPLDEIKELCFGYVPTIYREKSDRRRLDLPNDEARNLGYLQMATQGEIAETLVLIGCNNNAVQHYRTEGRRTSHLFPLSFEIVGMLGRTLHIDNSSFTYVPNPTPDRWDKRSVSLLRLLASYRDSFVREYPESLTRDYRDMHCNPSIINRINGHIDAILMYREDDIATTASDRLLFLNAVHAALVDADEILTAKPRAASTAGPGDVISKMTPASLRQTARRQLVQDVLRSHIQEVLRQLNDPDGVPDNQSLRLPDGRPPSPSFPGHNMPRPPHPRFEEINEASPDERESKFMDVYFGVIRPQVVKRAETSTQRRVSIVAAPPGFRFMRSGTARTHASESAAHDGRPGRLSNRRRSTSMHSAPPDRSVNDVMDEDDDDGQESDIDTEEDFEEPPPPQNIDLADEDASHHDIWCVLVFRMICWLMLHDFNKLDVQVSKSELLGSRMPVYIS